MLLEQTKILSSSLAITHLDVIVHLLVFVGIIA